MSLSATLRNTAHSEALSYSLVNIRGDHFSLSSCLAILKFVFFFFRFLSDSILSLQIGGRKPTWPLQRWLYPLPSDQQLRPTRSQRLSNHLSRYLCLCHFLRPTPRPSTHSSTSHSPKSHCLSLFPPSTPTTTVLCPDRSPRPSFTPVAQPGLRSYVPVLRRGQWPRGCERPAPIAHTTYTPTRVDAYEHVRTIQYQCTASS